jgi:hypothetical protein
VAHQTGKLNQEAEHASSFHLIEISAAKEKVGAMSQTPLIEEPPVVSARAAAPRTWAGTKVKAAERATHYLHLLAFPCEKCKGPVIVGWIGTRADDIEKETEITGIGAKCLLCGAKPEGLNDPTAARHFRPVEWEWMAEKKPEAVEPDGDPLTTELSQDADTAGSPEL